MCRTFTKKGQGLPEYGLILALIAILALSSLTATGSNLNTMLQKMNAKVAGTQSPPPLTSPPKVGR